MCDMHIHGDVRETGGGSEHNIEVMSRLARCLSR
jgi:hypothetical protein